MADLLTQSGVCGVVINKTHLILSKAVSYTLKINNLAMSCKNKILKASNH